MKWLSINDIKFGVKRKLYELEHSASGKTLIYNAQTKQYVGHLDNQTNYFKQNDNYTPQSNEYYDLFDSNYDNSEYNLF